MAALDILTYTETLVRDVKDRHVAEDPDNGDIAPVVVFERAGMIVAMCTARQVDRDQGLMLADVGIRGFAADAVILVVDAHQSKSETNPLTGERWGPGEMQKACDEDGACLTGVLQDTLLVLRVDRDLGTTHQRTHDYDVDKKAAKVLWHERADFGDGQPSGLVLDTLMRSFRSPTVLADAIATGAMPISLPGVLQSVVDDSTIAMLATLAGAVAVAQSSSEPEPVTH